MVARYPIWKNCALEDLRVWLCWHWCQGLLAAMADPSTGKLASVVAVRYVDEPDQFEHAYCHKSRGKICCVELAISETFEALLAAFDWIAARQGDPVYVLHERGTRGGKPKLRLWRRYRALLETQNGFKQT